MMDSMWARAPSIAHVFKTHANQINTVNIDRSVQQPFKKSAPPPHTFPPRFPARTRMIMVRHMFSHSSNFNRTARAWQSPWAGTHCTHRVAPVRRPNEKISVILDAVVVLRLFSSPVLVPPCKEFPHGEVVYPSVGWSCMQLQRQPRDSSSCRSQTR